MAETIDNSRLETFCDGIFAIAITLLILEIKIPPFESAQNYLPQNDKVTLGKPNNNIREYKTIIAIKNKGNTINRKGG
jgi:hypothetical protein